MKDNKVYLLHILDAIKSIEEYILSIASYDDFWLKENKMARDAIVRQLEIVGEASNNLSEDFRLKYNDIPWHKATGMRNNLIHEYHGVDLKVVWDTVKEDLPGFKRDLEKLIANL